MTTSQTCPLTVTFTPPSTKPWILGLKTATLTIKSNDRDNPTLNITLKARLKDAGVALAIGKTYQGGIIFYLDGTGEHGLIAAPSDQSSATPWSASTYKVTGATGTAIGTGQANTNAIITAQGADLYAAKLCDDLVLGGYSDWFLPSKDELNELYKSKVILGGSPWYWSSSEYDKATAWVVYFVGNGGPDTLGKYWTYPVRAVRAF